MSDDEEMEEMIGYYQPIPISKVEQLCNEARLDEENWNVYNWVLMNAKIYSDNGLTPKILYNTMTGNYYVTSVEAQEGNIN